MKYNKVKKYIIVKTKLKTFCIKTVVLKKTVWIYKHKTKSLNQKIIDIHGEDGGVKVTVEVVAILVASRKRATSIRNG